MKALIWIVCFLGCALLLPLSKGYGPGVAGVYSTFLFGLTWWIASTLCKKLDEYNRKNSRQFKTIDKPQEPYKNRFTECPKCGYIAVFEKKCPKCDFVLSTEEPEDSSPKPPKILFCRKCGVKLSEGFNFCKECGTEIITKVEETSDAL